MRTNEDFGRPSVFGRRYIPDETLQGKLTQRLLQECDVPASNEVAMVSVACEITVRKHESARTIAELSDIEDCLVEQDWYAGREPIRAFAVFDELRKLNVRFVVLRSEVFTVPARRKHNFQAQAICTFLVGESLVSNVVVLERSLRRESWMVI